MTIAVIIDLKADVSRLEKINSELLEALKEMYSRCTADTCDDTLAFKVKKAIANAEGKS